MVRPSGVSQGGQSESVTRDVTRPTERGYAPRPPYVPGLPRERRISAAAIGVGLTFVVAVAALVIAVVALTTRPAPATPSTAPSKPQVTSADDKALCQAIAPLMKENDDRANAFLGTGAPGSPERDGALPKFVSDTEDWARRTQAVLDAHANPPRFVTRALQRYIDDMQLFVASVRPGPGTQYDEAAWTDSIEAYGGPLATCQALGIGW